MKPEGKHRHNGPLRRRQALAVGTVIIVAGAIWGGTVMAGAKGAGAAAAAAALLGGASWWILRSAFRGETAQPGTPPPPPAPPIPPPSRNAPALATSASSLAREGGQFPVLHSPSRAAGASWLLPRTPAQPGMAADSAVLGDLQIRAASVIGPGHRGRGLPRQDAYRMGQGVGEGHFVAAVADGMSDSRRSDVGANVAVAAMVAALREALDEQRALEYIDAKEIFLAAAAQMYRTAEQRGWDPDDVRAVAVAAVVPARPASDDRRHVWLASLGDASAWRLREQRWKQLIGDEKRGLDAGSVNCFLPHDPGRVDHRMLELQPGDVMALTSDGVADALAAVPGAEGWFAERWRNAPAVGDFLLQVGFEQSQMQDDRTAVVIWCPEEEPRR